MKIVRLALFNLRKNRREAIAIIFLTFITAFLLGTDVANIAKMQNVFRECFEATGSVDHIIAFRDDKYREDFKDILTDEYGIEDVIEDECLMSINQAVRQDNGEKRSYNLFFVTEESEKKIENFNKGNRLEDDQTAQAQHPIWLPIYFEISEGYKPGDDFRLVAGGRDYPFTVAGFYEPGLMNNSNVMLKCVISDHDFTLLSGIFENNKMLCFDSSDSLNIYEYCNKCEEKSSDNIKQSLFDMAYESEDFAETMFLNMFMIINACMSLITMIAAIFLIRHKITNDIEDQMQQIGVLEALGYKSSDISLSYVCEYLMTVGAGTLLGAIGAVAFTPVMNQFIRGMMNRNVQGAVNIGMVILISAVLIVVITLFALDKARRVKAYPPVTALRKGISSHNFTRNILPLSQTFKSVNARLAMKGLFRNLKQNIGAGLCITLASLSFLYSIYAFDTFKDGYDSLYRIMGMEICNDSVNLLPGVDPYGFRDEVEALPEVRKALVSYSWKYLSVQGSDTPGMVSIFDDYKDCETLFLSEGRFPEHDNEIAISLKRKNMEGLNIGDSLIAEGNGMQKSYVVTGVLGAMSNSGMNLYLTREGYERMYPDSRPDTVMVYLNEGVDRTAFEKKLSSIYGASAVETQENKEAAGTLEDRIKRAADEKMALLVANYGVTDIDYAIKVGDQMITGSSSGMIIKDVNSIEDLAKTQMGAIAGYSQGFTLGGMIFVSVVIVIILWIIVSSNVRRRRKDLGIMKSMGYSSKDLMKQIAIEFLPTTIVAVIIAAVASIYLQKSFWLLVFGADIGINFLLLSLCSIGIVLFCYVVTYICAGRIKKISVNELMTE